MGLIGKGFYILPVTLLVAALQIILVRGKPIGARVACTLLLTVMGEFNLSELRRAITHKAPYARITEQSNHTIYVYMR